MDPVTAVQQRSERWWQEHVDRINAVPNHEHDLINEAAAGLLEGLETLWPHWADKPKCYDGGGGSHEVVGKDSAHWFSYGGGGRERRFRVTPGIPVIIVASGDMCPGSGNCIGRVNYVVKERTERSSGGENVWNQIHSFTARDRGLCVQRWQAVVPTTDELQLTTEGCFYFKLYQRSFSAEELMEALQSANTPAMPADVHKSVVEFIF